MIWTRIAVGIVAASVLAIASGTTASASTAPGTGHTSLAAITPSEESDAGEAASSHALAFDVVAFCEEHAGDHASPTSLCEVATSGQLPLQSQEIVELLIRAHSMRVGAGLVKHVQELLDGEDGDSKSLRRRIVACRQLLDSDVLTIEQAARCHELLERDRLGDFSAVERCESFLANDEAVAGHPLIALKCQFLIDHGDLDGFREYIEEHHPELIDQLKDRHDDHQQQRDERHEDRRDERADGAQTRLVERCEEILSHLDSEDDRPQLAARCREVIEQGGRTGASDHVRDRVEDQYRGRGRFDQFPGRGFDASGDD